MLEKRVINTAYVHSFATDVTFHFLKLNAFIPRKLCILPEISRVCFLEVDIKKSCIFFAIVFSKLTDIKHEIFSCK